mgnify:CR=1 FL=1
MDNSLTNFNLTGSGGALTEVRVQRELAAVNDEIEETGIVITEPMAKALAEVRAQALKDTGRFEAGAGALTKIIRLFSPTGYISQNDAEETFSELLSMFYYAKSETKDAATDDRLLEAMLDAFENRCFGDLELLRGRELEAMIRRINRGDGVGIDDSDNYSTGFAGSGSGSDGSDGSDDSDDGSNDVM